MYSIQDDRSICDYCGSFSLMNDRGGCVACGGPKTERRGQVYWEAGLTSSGVHMHYPEVVNALERYAPKGKKNVYSSL